MSVHSGGRGKGESREDGGESELHVAWGKEVKELRTRAKVRCWLSIAGVVEYLYVRRPHKQ